MAFSGENVDFINLHGGKKTDIENITSHKLAVVVFIREFCVLKQDSQVVALDKCPMAPKYRKDFCMLVLKLIQCPDLEFKELETLLRSEKYNLLSLHLQNFCARLKHIYEDGVSALMDCVSDAVETLMMEPQETNPCIISKSSVLGLYLRRMMLYLDKLSFSQVTSVYASFCIYYEKGRPGSLMRCLSKDKLNSSDSMIDFMLKNDERKFLTNMESSKRRMNFDQDSGVPHCQWSRRQAELFTAQQAALLQASEPRAISPPTLQNTISQILRDNPDYAEAHFLSYLNCMRERELCGALESLYGCFDRSVGVAAAPADRNKGFRYASLNLAVLHAQFGHKERALIALREATVMSQEAGDAACLQQAAVWALWAKHGAGGFGLRVARPFRPAAPCARHRTALGAQSFVKYAAVRKATPAHLFGFMIKSDMVHCQHSMADLMQTSLANRAALWSLYGKTEMASLCCQLLLNINTVGGIWESEAMCLAACGVAQILAGAGKRAAAHSALQHARSRAPRPPHCLLWMRTQHIIDASYALLAGKWHDAEQAANQLASIDRWESQLIKAELHFLKGEPVLAMTCVRDVLVNCQSDDERVLYLTLKIRAMLLSAQIENSRSGTRAMSSANISILNEALSLAADNYLTYQAAIIEMHVANVQLQLGCVKNALAIVQRVLATIMAHGGPYDQARGMLLYVKCRIACSPISGERRKKVFTLCIELLGNVKNNYYQVNAICRLKDVIYLQAQLHNEVGNIAERNKCALEYRQLDEQNPTKLSKSLLTCF